MNEQLKSGKVKDTKHCEALMEDLRNDKDRELKNLQAEVDWLREQGNVSNRVLHAKTMKYVREKSVLIDENKKLKDLHTQEVSRLKEANSLAMEHNDILAARLKELSKSLEVDRTK